MSDTRKPRVKVVVLAILVLLIGTSSSAISTSNGQVAQIAVDELLAGGDFETVLSIGGGTFDGTFVSFPVSELQVVAVSDCSGSAELQSFAADLVDQANAGAVDGVISFDTTATDLSSFDGIVPVDFTLNFDAVAVSSGTRGHKVVAAAADGPVAKLTFSGNARVAKGFNKDNFAMAGSLAPSTVTFGFSELFASTAGSGQKFKGRFTRFAVPNVGLRGTNLEVGSWGKTPKSVKKLDKSEINIESGSVEIDAVAGTITSKHRIRITKKS